MTPRNEDVIRDKLAQSLELIDLGLELVQTNYPLPNAHGTRGFIDILGRDRNGVFVVIEIKRSNKTAREALHEVMKYTELLNREKGIPSPELRAAIVSSHWSELLVPFSHFKRGWENDIRGYAMELADDGVTPVKLNEIEELEEVPSRGLTPTHTILVHQSDSFNTPIDDGWERSKRLLSEVGVDDLIGIELLHPRLGKALYLIIGKILSDDPRTMALDYLVNESGDEDISEDYSIEYVALSHLSRHLEDYIPRVAYPEKLAALTDYGGWKAGRIFRSGVFLRQEDLYPSSQVISRSAESVGQSQVVFRASSEPRNRQHWANFLTGVSNSLIGNEKWAHVLRAWLEEAASSNPRHNVVCHIYNPCDFITTLVYGWPDMIDFLIPSIEGAVDAPPEDGGRIIHGILAWGGRPIQALSDAISSVYSEPVDWGMAKSMGTVWHSDLELIERLGLDYGIVEFSSAFRGGALLGIDEIGKLTRTPPTRVLKGAPDWDSFKPMTHFLRRHEAQIEVVVEHFRSLMDVDIDAGIQIVRNR